MRLKQYLNEETGTYEDMVSLIKTNCKPFLRDGQTNYKYKFLYSGREYRQDFDMKTVRKNRRPMSTPLNWHTIMDDWFYKKFGVRSRSNAVFCSFDEDFAIEYGDPFVIFPFGRYVMISSDEVKDLFIEISREIGNELTNDEINKGMTNVSEEVKKRIIVNFLEESNYKKYNFNMNEQMVTCKKYYMISSDVEERLLEDLK